MARGWWLLVGPAACLLGACGGDDTPSTPTSVERSSTQAPASTPVSVADPSAPTVGDTPAAGGASIDCASVPVGEVEAVVQLGLVDGRPVSVNRDVTLLPPGVQQASVCNYDTASLGAAVSAVRFDTAGDAAARTLYDSLAAVAPAGATPLALGSATEGVAWRSGSQLTATILLRSAVLQVVVNEQPRRLDDAQLETLVELLTNRLA